MLRLLRAHPGKKAVYIAPLKALVRERMDDWGKKFVKKLGYKLEELTGDVRFTWPHPPTPFRSYAPQASSLTISPPHSFGFPWPSTTFSSAPMLAAPPMGGGSKATCTHWDKIGQ